MPATRRTILASVVPAALATGCHALPAEPHPDADLLALGRRWGPAYAEHDAACARAADLEDIGRPEPPAAVFVAPDDWRLGLAGYNSQRDDGRRWYAITAVDAPRHPLRTRWTRWVRREVRPEDNLPADATSVEVHTPWPEAQARADEIVSAWDGWRDAKRAVQDASGYTAAHAESTRLGRALSEIEGEIFDAIPLTLDGLAVQARVLLGEYGDECEDTAVLMLRTFVAMAAGETA